MPPVEMATGGISVYDDGSGWGFPYRCQTRSAGAAGSADNRSGGPLVAGNSDVSDVVVCNRPAFHGKNTAETKRGWLTFGQTGSRNSSHFVSEESEHGQKINQ
jgi:hypothetical protein